MAPAIRLFCALFCAMVQDCLAHNWINNPRSRVVGLSKAAPIPDRPSDTWTSVQVGAGQPFAIEWSVGHGNSVWYFAVVSTENEYLLSGGSVAQDILDEYLADAPSEYMPVTAKKYHSRCTGGNRGKACVDPLPGTDNAVYERQIVVGDAGFLDRPASWRCSRSPPNNGCEAVSYAQYEYTAAGYANDRRAAYTSTKFPWLIAAFLYHVVPGPEGPRPQDYDLAFLALPAGTPPGEYVVQSLWRGYYDGIDVRVLPTVSTDIYGSPTGSQFWVKTDHCQFLSRAGEEGNKIRGKCMVLQGNNTAACLASCMNKGSCTGVNVVPFANPPMVRFKDDVNIPFNSNNCQPSQVAEEAAAEGVGALVCYGLKPPKAPEVGSAWMASADPRDPVFYSTCYRKEEEWTFADSPASVEGPPSSHPAWRFRDQCVACAAARTNAGAPLEEVHRWQLLDECRLCI